MIDEDLTWLGVEWQKKIIQSNRIALYINTRKNSSNLPSLHVHLPGDEFRKLKDNSQACSCRDLSIADNLKRWKEMPFMSEGEAVLRVKTDLQHKNGYKRLGGYANSGF